MNKHINIENHTQPDTTIHIAPSTLEERWKIQMEREKADEPPIAFGEGIGIEIEYMIVSRDNLKILPIADKILDFFSKSSTNPNALRLPPLVDISNEIVKHLIEFKGLGPIRNLLEFATQMTHAIIQVNSMLETYDAMLLPCSMHPFMNPKLETHLWTGKYKEIYDKFHELFDLRKHCWSNVQGVHLNLPYNSPKQYDILTQAIRIVLPLIPAISSSSTICDGQMTLELDNRLFCQMDSRNRFDTLMGSIIPEQIFSVEEYKTQIFKKIDAELASSDPQIVLHPEWMNHRAAIPRFSRNCIEIKIIDVQENPILDIAICRFLELIIKGLMNNWWKGNKSLADFTSVELLQLYKLTIVDSENVIIDNSDYLEIFGIYKPVTAKALLQKIYTDIIKLDPIEDLFDKCICMILERGTLATRIRESFTNTQIALESADSGKDKSSGIDVQLESTEFVEANTDIANIFLELADCLQNGTPFKANII